MAALDLFKGDMGAYLRLYSFLSQIIDYGNTDVEKRAIFYRRLLPLLEFGREREGVDLSGIKLTHHTLKDEGKRDLVYGAGETPKLPGVSEVGSGGIHEKEKALLDEIIARVNDLFGADTTDNDQLVYVNQVLKGKLLESDELAQQAANNHPAQFANSPTLDAELDDAIMAALEAHSSLSRQALGSKKIRDGIKDALLGPGQLYEALRARGDRPPTPRE
jgi:type I restriction enzyme R subunit